jgi:ATP-dependent DNA helicase RecG
LTTWGRGIEKIEDACRAEGKPLPVFQAKAREISVSFPIAAAEYDAEAGRSRHATKTGETVNETANQPGETVNETANHTPETVNETVRLEDQIIAEVTDDSQITYTALAAKLAVSRATLARAVKRLREEGRLGRTGSDKTGRWVAS